MPPELYAESIPAGEEEVIGRFARDNAAELERDYPGNNRPARRRLHAKHHGCVCAEFRVLDNIPQDLRFGVFQTPRSFPALVRFSNGFRVIQHDKERDARGLAMKLLGVPGEKLLDDERDATTQDFTLLNHDVFFIRNAADFEPFANSVAVGKPFSFLFGWNPFQWKLHEAITLLTSSGKKVNNPLAVQYWSAAASRLGPRAAKMTAIPRIGVPVADFGRTDPDFLYKAMAEQLRRGEVRFEIHLQLQTDPVRMPIEDPTISWSESLSPFRQVAELRIPTQDFDDAPQMEYCENLSFTAWHSLPEHQPLGGINRMRRAVYRSTSEARHRMNEAPRREPTWDDLPEFIRETFGRLGIQR
jgi:hypothetical protein